MLRVSHFFAVIVYVVTYLVKNTPIYKPKSGFHAFCWLRDTEIGSKPNVVDDCYWFPSWCCFQWTFPLWKILKNSEKSVIYSGSRIKQRESRSKLTSTKPWTTSVPMLSEISMTLRKIPLNFSREFLLFQIILNLKVLVALGFEILKLWHCLVIQFKIDLKIDQGRSSFKYQYWTQNIYK